MLTNIYNVFEAGHVQVLKTEKFDVHDSEHDFIGCPFSRKRIYRLSTSPEELDFKELDSKEVGVLGYLLGVLGYLMDVPI